MIKVTVKSSEEFDLLKDLIKDYFDISEMFYQDDLSRQFPLVMNYQFSEDFPNYKMTESCRLARMKDTKDYVLKRLLDNGLDSVYIDVCGEIK